MTELTLLEKLTDIQTKLSVPKNQLNKFGNYMYRSCEDILEAVKPYLNEHKLSLTLTDEIVLIGDRFYVKATAALMIALDKCISVSAYAREASEKKGMDDSQITGSASSYARKYALNGLFCIDDVKDADTTNKHENGTEARKTPVEEIKDKVVSDKKYACYGCGIEITEKVNKFSVEKYKLPLCFNCQKQHK